MTLPPPRPNSPGSALEWAIAGAGFPEEGVKMFTPAEKPKKSKPAGYSARNMR